MRFRDLTILAFAIGLVLAAPGHARAGPVEVISTDYSTPTVISFWTNGPDTFSSVSGLPSGWGSVTTAGSTFGQVQGAGGGPFSFALNYNDPGNATFNVDIQQNIFVPGFGVVFGTKEDFFYNGTSFVAGTYGAGGGPAGAQGPVPEPASLLVLGLGLAGYAWKRRRSVSPV